MIWRIKWTDLHLFDVREISWRYLVLSLKLFVNLTEVLYKLFLFSVLSKHSWKIFPQGTDDVCMNL